MKLDDLRNFTRSTDRYDFLASWFEKEGIAVRRISIGDSRHLVVRFDQGYYQKNKPLKLFVAHYDRAPGSPGALDNSAACAQLASFAKELSYSRLNRSFFRSNVILVFTDGEELSKTKPAEQGSYSLGKALCGASEERLLGLVFDVTGRGEIVVVSNAVSHKVRKAFACEIDALCEEVVRKVRDDGMRVMKLSLPYSDELGFVAAGIPAICISLLPEREANEYFEACRSAIGNTRVSGKQAGRAVTNEVIASLESGDIKAIRSIVGSKFPATWNYLHTVLDDVDLVEPKSFEIVSRVLHVLAKWRPSDARFD
jgi:hypothetical protein